MTRFNKLTAIFVAAGITIGMVGCAEKQSIKSDAKQNVIVNPEDRLPNTQAKPVAPAPAPAKPVAPAPVAAYGDGLIWNSMAYPTGVRDTSVILVEKGVPAEVGVGTPFEYKIKVTNLSKLTLDNVLVTDTVGEGFEVISADPTYTDNAGGKLRWAFPKMGPNEVKVITVKGRATRVGTIGSCAEVAYNSVLCATIPVVEPKLALTKTLTPEVLACEPIVATFTVTNNGTGAAKNVKIVDNLPQGLATAQGGKTVSVDVGTLAPGQSRQATVELRASGTGSYTNTATATADGGLKAEAKSQTVVKKPVLSIACAAFPTAYIGRDICAEATLKNTGDGVAKNTVVTANVPAGVTVKSVTQGGVINGNTVTWNVASMAAGSTGKFQVCYAPSATGTYSVTFNATAFCADAVNVACPTTVEGIPAILLEVVDTDPVRVGETTTYTVTVTNQGSAPGIDVNLDATLEEQMEFVSGTGATAVTAKGKAIDIATLPTLAPGAKAEWKIVVKATAVGDVRFKISMTEKRLTRPVEETEATNFWQFRNP